MKSFILLVVLILTVSGNVLGQEKKVIRGGIVNGKAEYLPKPDYPEEAKNSCANGKVEIEVIIDESGNVIKAKAISGDELLRNSAVEAAMKAKFSQTLDLPRIKIKGIVVYNFVSEIKCLVALRVVNKRALSIPKPQIANFDQPKHLQIKEAQTVIVQIVVDESGRVIYAKAISGHSMFRAACETSARQAKFSPLLYTGPPIKVKALLVYKFKPNGTIEF